MSALFDLSKAEPLGKGSFAPAGSIRDPELSKLVAGYKRTIASRYRSLGPDELDELPTGLWVSPKIDGELWFLVVEGAEIAIVAPNGKVLSGELPVLAEAKKLVAPRAKGQLVLAGELFAVRKGGRPRVGDLAKAMGGGEAAEVDRIGFHVFDLLTGGDGENPGPMPEYGDRLAAMRRLCEGGKRLQCIRTEEANDVDRVRALFTEWVEGGKGEGLVARSKDIGRTYKIKPFFTLDAAVIAYTVRTDEPTQVRSLLLAVMKEDGQFQLIGSCGNMGSGDLRAELFTTLSGDVIPSGYSHASSSGALFQFVKPSLVVEVKLTDLQAEDSDGKPIRRMVLELASDESRWTPVAPMVGVSILHPVLERVRTDKTVNPVDVRAGQVLERVFLEDVDKRAERIELPASEVIERRVWTKTTKGQVAVRKLVMWQTHKEKLDPSYPAFVVQWTDYSAGRKDPLQRDVRRAPDEASAREIADAMIADGVKRGWTEYA
ncbi:MAG: ATP-dependent DNA ligase [Myxococcales bacterium]|nr:ATP-dependent DNA ligase [Myxococcales bacterium]